MASTLAVVGLSIAGCGSGGGNGSTNPSTQTSTVRLDEKANGKTLDLAFGDTIIVTLHSTYWSFAPPSGNILQPIGTPTVGKGLNCPNIPGSGCGTVSMTYNVGVVGSGGISAHRTSCGEALRCTGTQGDWSVTINSR